MTVHPHGTHNRYLRDKCRCTLCTEANRVYSRQFRKHDNAHPLRCTTCTVNIGAHLIDGDHKYVGVKRGDSVEGVTP